jgi:type III pantothenate kinase
VESRLNIVMNLIAVDVGNTSTAVGRWSDGRVSRIRHINGGLAKSPDEVRAALKYAIGNGKIDGIAYLSVVPNADKAWERLAKREAHLPFFKVDYRLISESKKGESLLTFDYPKPETIGADRLADAAAAINRYGAPVLVCDFGTAFTAAAITSDLVWRGGVIAPGFPLMRDYLFERTAKLPKMKLGGKCPRIGRSTEEAMRFGAIVGFRGMIREIVTELSKNFETDFKLVATGGFAGWVLKGFDLPFIVDPTLTLHGAGLLGKLAAERKVK